MSPKLRPMSTGEVLDRTFNLYRNHFLLFTGISVGQVMCMMVGVLLVYLLAGALAQGIDSPDPAFVGLAIVVYMMVVGLFYLIGYALGTGATIYAVSKLHLGYAAGIVESYREMRPMVWRTMRIVITVFVRLMGIMMLTELVIGTLAVIVIRAKPDFRGSSLDVAFNIFLFTVFVAGSAWAARVTCQYSLAVPACVLERLPARQALKRSSWLTARALGRIFLAFLLMGILSLGLFYALQIPGFLVAESHPGFVAFGLRWAGIFISMILAFPIGTIALSLIYYDQRVRKEAFDLQVLMDALAGQPQVQPASAPLG